MTTVVTASKQKTVFSGVTNEIFVICDFACCVSDVCRTA